MRKKNPRYQPLTQELHQAIYQAYLGLLKDLGENAKFVPPMKIYNQVAESPSPSFYISDKVGRRIIRSKTLFSKVLSERDEAFYEAFKETKESYKEYAHLIPDNVFITEALKHPAPKFYVSGHRVSSIVKKEMLKERTVAR